MTKQYPQQHWKVPQIQELFEVLCYLFLLPILNKTHTQKDKCTLGQNIFTTHISKLGTTSRFVESQKRKNNLLKHYLPIYLPSSLFCYLLLSNSHSPSTVYPLLATKMIKPYARHFVTRTIMTTMTMKQTFIFRAYLLPFAITIMIYKFHMEVVVENSRVISEFLII